MKTVKYTVITKTTTITTTTDHATAIHEDFKFIKCTTQPRRTRYLKNGTIFYSNTKTKTELENDIFQFTRKLWLIYYYWNSNIVDESTVKLELTYTPQPNKNDDFENVCKE